MATRHQKHLMAAKQRKERKAMEEQNKSETIDQKAVIMDSNTNLDKVKRFARRHKKALIICGSLAAAALAAVVAHKAIKNNLLNNTIKDIPKTTNFHPASQKAVKQELKLEMKGAPKRNVLRALSIKFPKTNHYHIAPDGTIVNTTTGRVLTHLLDRDGEEWVLGFLNDTIFSVSKISNLIDDQVTS